MKTITRKTVSVLTAIAIVISLCSALSPIAFACDATNPDTYITNDHPDSATLPDDTIKSMDNTYHVFVRYIAADTKLDLLKTDEFVCQEGECFDITPALIPGYERALPSTISGVAQTGSTTFIVWFLPYSYPDEDIPVSNPEADEETDAPCDYYGF